MELGRLEEGVSLFFECESLRRGHQKEADDLWMRERRIATGTRNGELNAWLSLVTFQPYSALFQFISLSLKSHFPLCVKMRSSHTFFQPISVLK